MSITPRKNAAEGRAKLRPGAESGATSRERSRGELRHQKELRDAAE